MRRFSADPLRTFAAVLLACALVAPAFGIDFASAMKQSQAAVGLTVDDYAFTSADGRRVRMSDYRGKPLVVSFVYTGCSQVCPTTNRFLKRAVAEARRVVGADAFRVVSIGFDIPADNPLSLKVFARQNGVDDPRWDFLTPDAGVPEALARELGFAYKPQSGGFEHLAQVTILDGSGHVYAQVYGESFEVPMLVRPLTELALGEPAAPRTTVAQWIDHVRLVCTVYDPVTGKYRLDYALFMETGAGVIVLGSILAFLVRELRRWRKRPC